MRKFRFEASGNGTSTIFRECLLSLIAVQSNDTTSTNLTFPISAMRVDRVTVWGALDPSTSSSTGRVGLTWLARGPAQETVEATGPSRVACISQSPPHNSLAGFWSTANEDESEALFVVEYLTKSIVDIEVAYVLSESSSSHGVGTTGTYLTSYAHLDCLDGGASAGGQKLAPYGLTPTALTARTAVSPPLPGARRIEEEEDSNPEFSSPPVHGRCSCGCVKT